MDFKKFIDFIWKNLDFFDKEDIWLIIRWEYDSLFDKLNEKYTNEQDTLAKKRLENIAMFLENFIETYNKSSYKFSYEKSEKFEHYLYWYNFYLSNNFLTNAEATVREMETKFPERINDVIKLWNKIKKQRDKYDKESDKLRLKILKKNKLKQIELLIWQWEYWKAMYEALELLQEFPNEPQIKKYLTRIDALKASNVREWTKITWDFFEKVWMLSLSKAQKLEKNDLNEIFKKLSHLKKAKDFDSWLALIAYVKDKHKLEDSKLIKFQNAFVEEKSKIQMKQQSVEYKLELNSLKLLIKNKQYREALVKANSILKKYPLIDKKGIFWLIQKIDKQRKTALNQANSLDAKFQEFQIKMSKLNKKWVIQFYEKMAWFLWAKIDLKVALQIVYHQSKNLWLKKFVRSLLEWVDWWMKISEVLRWYPVIWRQDVAMIKIWETTWQLWRMFQIIAAAYKENEQRRKKIKSMMIYPSVVIVVTILIFIALIITVIPKFKEFYASLWFQLPLVTRVVIYLSDFFVNYWYIAWVEIIGLIFGYKFFSKSKIWRYTNSRLALKMPVVKELVYRKYIIQLTWNIWMLLKSWISLLEALDLIVFWTENSLYQDEFKRLRFELETWVSFAKSLWLASVEEVWSYSNKFIPIDIAYSVDIWERTWQLWQLMSDTAERYDDDLKLIIQNLNSLMEPFIIILVWWVVFIFVLSVFLPMINMYSMMDKM